jgi:hypothetical protein
VDRSARPEVKTQEVKCDEFADIYENHTRVDLCVTITVTDSCEGTASNVFVENADGDDVATMEIPDGGTKTGSFTVPAGGGMELGCEGSAADGGCCEYQIVVDPFCASEPTLSTIDETY